MAARWQSSAPAPTWQETRRAATRRCSVPDSPRTSMSPTTLNPRPWRPEVTSEQRSIPQTIAPADETDPSPAWPVRPELYALGGHSRPARTLGPHHARAVRRSGWHSPGRQQPLDAAGPCAGRGRRPPAHDGCGHLHLRHLLVRNGAGDAPQPVALPPDRTGYPPPAGLLRRGREPLPGRRRGHCRLRRVLDRLLGAGAVRRHLPGRHGLHSAAPDGPGVPASAGHLPADRPAAAANPFGAP